MIAPDLVFERLRCKNRGRATSSQLNIQFVRLLLDYSSENNHRRVKMFESQTVIGSAGT